MTITMRIKRREENDHRYLVCRGDARGGAGQGGSRVSVFGSEPEARGAFQRLRTDDALHAGWGELAVVDGSGRFTVLAWFGRPSPPITGDGSQRPRRAAGNGRSR